MDLRAVRGAVLMSIDFMPATVDRKARKVHRCDDCYRDITVGETYNHSDYIWNGRWVTWNRCGHCNSVMHTVWNLRLVDLEDYLESDIWDALRDSGQVSLMRLRVAIKWKWHHRSGELMPVPEVVPRQCYSCTSPVDEPNSHIWCAPCDEKRIAHIGRQLSDLVDAFTPIPRDRCDRTPCACEGAPIEQHEVTTPPQVWDAADRPTKDHP